MTNAWLDLLLKTMKLGGLAGDLGLQSAWNHLCAKHISCKEHQLVHDAVKGCMDNCIIMLKVFAQARTNHRIGPLPTKTTKAHKLLRRADRV